MIISVRDVLTWVQFMNTTSSSLSPTQSFIHGAHLVFLDALGCGGAVGGAEVKAAASSQMRAILESHGVDCNEEIGSVGGFCYHSDSDESGIQPFMIPQGTV